MTDPVPPLPPRVVAFIRDHVTSLLQLETLLLIVESGRQSRSAADVSAQMYLPEATVAQWLDGYVVNRIVLASLDTDSEARTWVYLLRALMFIAIIGAIIDKNMQLREKPPGRHPEDPPSSVS